MTTPLALALPETSGDMHHIFTIPELVTAIITEFVSNGTRGSLVRGLSLAIFRLLAPVEDRQAGQDVFYEWDCSFKTLPMPSGWARFDVYRSRDHINALQFLRDISIISGTYSWTENDLPASGRISLTDIQSLFQCRSVVRFRINHACPLQLSNDDIKSILQNWVTLKELVLNPSPTYFSPSDVSHPYSDWETLTVIAEHGGHLERLGLYLNGFAEIPPRASMPSFPELIQLKVGTSELPSEIREAAQFLSQLLTLQCRVLCPFMSPDHVGWGALAE
ncbi:hypothetical protein IW261DRAFT_1655755 [Armillaria novae-zelandiae]|uniref:Uncharacterized protein n=1 Tax=Armillaria novae-zelandiae TaxID=153914 RepID=A0AA39PP40_9AGAR|nr:hypothetical protein IW261DRAFT_1655755 [Armillaria novae-zelandiae]